VHGGAADRAGAVVLGTAALAPGSRSDGPRPLTFNTIANDRLIGDDDEWDVYFGPLQPMSWTVHRGPPVRAFGLSAELRQRPGGRFPVRTPRWPHSTKVAHPVSSAITARPPEKPKAIRRGIPPQLLIVRSMVRVPVLIT
jgi:hypothetical protein